MATTCTTLVHTCNFSLSFGHQKVLRFDSALHLSAYLLRTKYYPLSTKLSVRLVSMVPFHAWKIPLHVWCDVTPPLRFLPARSMSSVVARWLHCWSPWSSQPVESCASVSQRKASDEGRRVPLLIRAVPAIINRCWQELKFGTNLSHFTVRQSQIRKRGRAQLC